MDYVKSFFFGSSTAQPNDQYTGGRDPVEIDLQPQTLAALVQAPRPDPSLASSPVQCVIDFHQRTKHGFVSYAPGPPAMDWNNQPDVFRHYKGAPKTQLPLPPFKAAGKAAVVSYDEVCDAPLAVPPALLSLDTLSHFFYYATALSAWKSTGKTQWSLRVHPSSGALFAMETYVLIPNHILGEKTAGGSVCHYNVKYHRLEGRTTFADPAGHLAVLEATNLPPDSFLVAVSTIFWREVWKYGERGYRYCLLDAGHVLAQIAASASLNGWKAHLLYSPSDEQISRVFGLARPADFPQVRQELEDAEMLILVTPNTAKVDCHLKMSESVVAKIARGKWTGRASASSPNHHTWPALNTMCAAAVKPITSYIESPRLATVAKYPAQRTSKAATVIYSQRRSAHEFIPEESTMEARVFFKILARLVPALSPNPWGSLAGLKPRIHLALLVNRVEGLVPGLYFLGRSKTGAKVARRALSPQFLWTDNIPYKPPELPFYFLMSVSNIQEVAKTLSCDQEIARDGAFTAVIFTCQFQDFLNTHGAHAYRWLMYEAGVVGNALYHEAESELLRGTGMGCFNDDPTTQMLGASASLGNIQSFYHFAIGKEVPDHRLKTLQSYPPPGLKQGEGDED